MLLAPEVPRCPRGSKYASPRKLSNDGPAQAVGRGESSRREAPRHALSPLPLMPFDSCNQSRITTQARGAVASMTILSRIPIKTSESFDSDRLPGLQEDSTDDGQSFTGGSSPSRQDSERPGRGVDAAGNAVG